MPGIGRPTGNCPSVAIFLAAEATFASAFHLFLVRSRRVDLLRGLDAFMDSHRVDGSSDQQRIGVGVYLMETHND